MVAWPFLSTLIGVQYSIYAACVTIYLAERLLKKQRRKAEEEGISAQIAYQEYLARYAKRVFLIRMIPVAIAACFIEAPVGLIYALFSAFVSVAEVMWESAKLGDLKAKKSNQPSQPMRADGPHG